MVDFATLGVMVGWPWAGVPYPEQALQEPKHSSRSPIVKMYASPRHHSPRHSPRHHTDGKHRRRRQILLIFIGVLLFVIVWSFALISMAISITWAGSSSVKHHQRSDNVTLSIESHGIADTQQNGAMYHADRIATEIPGIELKIPSPVPNEDQIQIVYAINNATLTAANNKPPKGIVLLLHACTHSALKFFSPSPSTCPNCMGLSEELQIARITIKRGYIPVAVSSVDRKRGCWSMLHDVARIEAVLKHDFVRAFLTGGSSSIFAIGASSGGAFAAELATRGIVDAALVMVMSLSNRVTGKLRTSPKPIYLAPMPRDEGMTKMVVKNYHDLKSVKDFIIMDTTNCGSLPVTTGYLIQRVPGMTLDAGDELISLLKMAGHIDSSNMMKVDPTLSEWRNIISPLNSTHWLDKYYLKPGCSPLAKALHRAWAFHEYCSEAVLPALIFFEKFKR